MYEYDLLNENQYSCNDNVDLLRCSSTQKRCLTAREANAILNHVHRHGICRGQNIPRRKYYCEECQSYHLTHYPFRIEDEIKIKEKRASKQKKVEKFFWRREKFIAPNMVTMSSE